MGVKLPVPKTSQNFPKTSQNLHGTLRYMRFPSVRLSRLCRSTVPAPLHFGKHKKISLPPRDRRSPAAEDDNLPGIRDHGRMTEYQQDPQSRQDGRPPEDAPAADKLPGRVPTASEMQRNWDRKIFDPKGMLFMDVLRDGFFGMCIAIIGAGLLWFGFSRPANWKIVGAGALTLFGGILTLQRAGRAWRAMKASARA